MIRRISKWPRRAIKFLRLGPAEKVSLIASLWFLPLIGRSLRRDGLTIAGSRFVPNPSRRPGSLSPERICELVELATRYSPGKPNCLVRSLALQRLLHRNGYRSELRIGTRTENGRFEAHAWVEIAGRVINDAADIGLQFTAFDSLIGNSWFDNVIESPRGTMDATK